MKTLARKMTSFYFPENIFMFRVRVRVGVRLGLSLGLDLAEIRLNTLSVKRLFREV